MPSQPTHTAPATAAKHQGSKPADVPAGRSLTALLALNAVAIVIVAVLFWLGREPINNALGWTTYNAGEGPQVPGASTVDPTDDGTQEDLASAQDLDAAPGVARTVEPSEPSLTLLDIVDAVAEVDRALAALISEGGSEMEAFAELTSPEPTRAARAKRRFEAWGRIWLNRLAVIDKVLPANSACAVHAGMDPACRGLRRILDDLRQLPTLTSVEEASAALDTATLELAALLRPSPDEPDDDDDTPANEAPP